MSDMGEFLVGAYLTEVEGCQTVLYNVKFPQPGLKGLQELDVIGLDFTHKKAFLCEVTTHLGATLYGNKGTETGYQGTARKIRAKLLAQKGYADEFLEDFDCTYMYWAPRIGPKLSAMLQDLAPVVFVSGSEYAKRMGTLREGARGNHKMTGNPAFRVIQILENLPKVRPAAD